MKIGKLEYDVVLKTTVKFGLWTAIKMRIAGMYRPTQNKISLEDYYRRIRSKK